MKLAYLHPNQFLSDINILHKYIQTEKFCIIRISQLAAHHDVGIKGLNLVLVKEIVNRIEHAGF